MKRSYIPRISAKQIKELALRRKIKQELIDEYGYKCMECGTTSGWPPLELSHETALSQEGKTTRENCKLLCHKCHAEKKHHEKIAD